VKLRRVEAFASAKVNLGWRVGPVREDGYHDVSGALQTISLRDRLVFEVSSGEGVRVVVPGHPDLEGESNLVDAAARVIAERVDPIATTVTIEKHIPVAAGLGGGSADAAAALLAFNVLWGAELSARKLVELGATIGSDVPALLIGGLVHASGRGERVKRIGSTSGYSIVLGITDGAISTADAYRVFDTMPEVAPTSWVHNDLEGAACALFPGLHEKVDAMREAAGVAFVSGSGPTVVGLVETRDVDGTAERVRSAFDRVEIAEPTESGVQLRLPS